jgi:hypothetical protein
VSDERRAVAESKAMIQPFAAEEEAGSQRAPQLIRNEGSNGSHNERGTYKGNTNDKNSLQGNIAELGNNVYRYGTRDQGEKVHQNGGGNSQLCWKRIVKK